MYFVCSFSISLNKKNFMRPLLSRNLFFSLIQIYKSHPILYFIFNIDCDLAKFFTAIKLKA